jgi:aspartate aminotransferase
MAVAGKIKEMMERSSWIRKMFETGAQLKAQHGAENVYDFSLGNPNLEPPLEFTKALKEILEEDIHMKHAYMPNAGYPDVREQIAEYVSNEQGVKVSGNHVIMTCGAGGGLNVAIKTVTNPGDQILAPAPCFMEYNFYADNHGGVLDLVPCKEDFDIDVAAVESRISAKTAAIIINSPNNPSGRVFPESTLKELGEMLRRKQSEFGRAVYLISDEPYRKIVYDGVEVPSILSCYENSIVVTSYSKDLSIPGERIGWLAVHPEADDVNNLMGGLTLCNRILGYVNAPALMQRAVGRLQGLSVDVSIYQKKRDLLCDGLAELGYQFTKPQGAFYLFPRTPGDDMEMVSALQEEMILVVPGRGCGLPNHIRIAYCVEDEVIKRSMEGFGKVAQKLL